MSEDAHSRPSGDAPEPLYDANIPTPTHAERARTLVAQISVLNLCEPLATSGGLGSEGPVLSA